MGFQLASIQFNNSGITGFEVCKWAFENNINVQYVTKDHVRFEITYDSSYRGYTLLTYTGRGGIITSYWYHKEDEKDMLAHHNRMQEDFKDRSLWFIKLPFIDSFAKEYAKWNNSPTRVAKLIEQMGMEAYFDSLEATA